MFKHILVTTDGSDLANLALPLAKDFAMRLGSEITLLYVEPSSRSYLPPTDGFVPSDLYERLQSDLHSEGQQLLDHALKQLDLPIAKGRTVEAKTRDVAQVISEEAEKLDSDMSIMSTHGRSGLKHLLLGSVAERVVRTAKTPVLLVKPPKQEPRPSQKQEAKA
jgi:nucleotide-binding universal stress UspA family protein